MPGDDTKRTGTGMWWETSKPVEDAMNTEEMGTIAIETGDVILMDVVVTDRTGCDGWRRHDVSACKEGGRKREKTEETRR